VTLFVFSVLFELGWGHDLIVSWWARGSRIETVGDTRRMSGSSFEQIVVSSVEAAVERLPLE
jgi:hypothetical protein